MAFSLSGITNASAEAARADHYSGTNGIRLFTVGQATPASHVSYPFLHTIAQEWTAASRETVMRGGLFGYFSAVCWEMGRTIHDGLGGSVPVGLISSNWPGTTVQTWTPDAAYLPCCSLFPEGANACRPGGQGLLFDAMIAPFAVGPLTLNGFSWYQGESNTVPNNDSLAYNAGARFYSCCFPAMITAWREAFKGKGGEGAASSSIPGNEQTLQAKEEEEEEELFFGFVQLSTWCNPDQSGIAPMRGQLGVPTAEAGQMAAMSLPNVAYVTNADHGNGCGIHPPDKQFPGMRLGNAALNIVLKKDIPWQSPTYERVKTSPSPSLSSRPSSSSVSVTVSLAGVGAEGLHLIHPYNAVTLERSHLTCESVDVKANESGTCGWASIKFGGVWLNASVAIDGKSALTLTSSSAGVGVAGGAAATVEATAYGWAPIPMMNVYDISTGLPLLPWNRTLKK